MAFDSHGKLSAVEVEAALSHLDPGCTRDEWIRIGMAVKYAAAEAGDTGEQGAYFAAWDSWSRGCPEKYKAADALRAWRSFKPDRGVTVGTLVHLASRSGWLDPRRSRRAHQMGWRPRASAVRPSSSPPQTSSAPVAAGPEGPALPSNLVEAFANQGLTLETIYDYGADFKVCRCMGKTGRKEIRPLCRREGVWKFGVPEGPRPLFNLSAVQEADPSEPVLVVEGEKCALAASSLGFLATTSSGGAGAAKVTDWSVLRGRRVIVLPDRDDAGEAYLRDVERLLALEDCEIRVIRLDPRDGSALVPGFDLADWISEGPDLPTERLAADLRGLIDGAAAVRSRSRVSIVDDLEELHLGLSRTHGKELLGLASGCLPSVDRMLDGWRGFGVLAAEPGIGKTTLMLQVGLGIVQTNPQACFVLVSLEMDRQTMLHRMVCQVSGLEIGDLRRGSKGASTASDGLRFDRDARHSYDAGMRDLRARASRIHLLDMQSVPLGLAVEDLADWLAARVREVKARTGCLAAFVAIDHLSLIPVGLHGAASALDRDDARVMVALRAQRSLGDPVFVISQLRKTDYQKPGLASAKGSGQIVYAPDIFMTLSRLEAEKSDEDAVRPPSSENPIEEWSLLRLKIDKGRDGVERREVKLRFWTKAHQLEEAD